MIDENISNQDLSEYYIRVVRKHAFNMDTYNKIKRKISRSRVDFASHYRNNGNLNNLGIRGVGVKTRKVLEMILELGVDEAKKNYLG